MSSEEKIPRPPGTIPVKWFFNLFLLFVVAVPLAIAGYVSVNRASSTAFDEVRRGNQRAATAVAQSIGEYVEGERKLLQSMGEASVQMRDSMAHEAVLDSFLVKNRHIARASIFNTDGLQVAGEKGLAAGLERALGDKKATISAIDNNVGELSVGHAVIWTEPLWVAGVFSGAIVAEVELVGLWQPVKAVRVGSTGFVRLVTKSGKLLAHGKAEERRKIFSGDPEQVDRDLLEAAFSGRLYLTSAGDELIVSAAGVPSIDSFVVIEQTTREALGGVGDMKMWLYLFFAAAIGLAILFGLFLARRVVRPLESLAKHVGVLGKGDLAARINDVGLTKLSEVRGLAGAVNNMAGELDTLQQEKLGQARLNTFARVAAGLSHDIRHPIESVRAACYDYLAHPDDPVVAEMFREVTEVDLPRLKKFVDDLQGLAKTGSLSVERVDQDAFSIALEAVGEIKVAPKWRRVVEFGTEGEDVSAEVSVDPSLIKRALYNLMNNAGEACMDGNGVNGKERKLGQVKVAVEVDEAAEMVAFHVSDTGCGIEESRLAELMTSDFKSTKRSTGVGLGLGVVRQVAESHGGRLAIASTLGFGSTFTIFLPRVPGHTGFETRGAQT